MLPERVKCDAEFLSSLRGNRLRMYRALWLNNPELLARDVLNIGSAVDQIRQSSIRINALKAALGRLNRFVVIAGLPLVLNLGRS
jgi:hypothetical protein